VNVHTTCAGCGGPLHYTDGINYHNGEPPCTPRPTQAERLALEWRDAVEAGDHARAYQLARDLDELDNRPPRLLDAALAYAAWGWPVFPLHQRSKIPATRHGFKDATVDPERIRGWWTNTPYNIGLPTGRAFDVIDIDVPAGVPSYHQLLTGNELPDIHGWVSTASGGMHLYIEPSGDGNRAGIMPGIDYRGAGGYVVAPPSRLTERHWVWSWITRPSPRITRPNRSRRAA
jgi:hypothetical protein